VLTIVLLRFLLGIDFVVYRRQQFAVDSHRKSLSKRKKLSVSEVRSRRRKAEAVWNFKVFYDETSSEEEEDATFPETETSEMNRKLL
jgi:hypothetical protein